MDTNIIKNNNSTIDIVVKDTSEQWTSLFPKAKESLKRNIELPGFRKGKAPAALVEKNITEEKILAEAKRMHLNTLYQRALKDAEKFRIITSPIAKDNKITKEEINITFTVGVMPEIKLGNYKGLEYKFNAIEISQEEIDKEVKHLQNRFATQEVKEEGTLAMNDIGVIDFEGFLDGVAFEGGRGQNHPLEIGSKSFIPGFEEQLVGMKQNDIKDIKVVFPENYPAKNLKGKEVTFKVKLNQIKTKKLPEADESLVKSINMPNVKSFEELITQIRQGITQAKENAAEQQFRQVIMNEIVKSSEIPVPDSLKDNEVKYLLEDFKARITQQGMSYDNYLKMSNSTDETVKSQLAVEALQRIKVSFALSEIAKTEKLEITDKEVNAELEAISKNHKQPIEEVKANINMEQIRNSLKNNLVVKLIKENLKK